MFKILTMKYLLQNLWNNPGEMFPSFSDGCSRLKNKCTERVKNIFLEYEHMYDINNIFVDLFRCLYRGSYVYVRNSFNNTTTGGTKRRHKEITERKTSCINQQFWKSFRCEVFVKEYVLTLLLLVFKPAIDIALCMV